jgi:hypothetical protein
MVDHGGIDNVLYKIDFTSALVERVDQYDKSKSVECEYRKG